MNESGPGDEFVRPPLVAGDGHRWRKFPMVLFLVGVAWIVISRMPPTESARGATVSGPQIDMLAPDFTLTATNGRAFTLADLRGTPVIVNFWATWCPPCRAEMPELEQLWIDNERGRDLMLLGVNQGEGVDAIERFRTRVVDVTFPLLLDQNTQTAQKYNVRALPTTYFIDADGRIQDIKIGGPMDRAMLLDGLNKIREQ